MTQQEQLQKELQAAINSTTYSPREESGRRQALYTKNEAERATLKQMKAAVKAKTQYV